MLAEVEYSSRGFTPSINKTAVASFDRRFNLPMELAGVSMSINGVSVGIKELRGNKIIFVAPAGIGQNLEVLFPVVINFNGVVFRGEILFVAFRPDIFRTDQNPQLNRAKVFNVTNRVHTREPFTARTLQYRGGVKVNTKLRMYLTGVEGLPGNIVGLQIGGMAVQGNIGNAVPVEPGIYTMDFSLAPSFDMLGDQPITITILTQAGVFQGRRDNDAPRIKIL